MYQVIQVIRLLTFPAVSFLVVTGLAWNEWSNYLEIQRIALKFKKNSEIRVFHESGTQEVRGRKLPVYEYQEDGEAKTFPTYREIELPPDGRVRIGKDPFPAVADYGYNGPSGEIAVPIDESDSLDAIYLGLKGKEMKSDKIKASLVSIGALVTGVAAFFLQRELARAFFGHRSPRRRRSRRSY